MINYNFTLRYSDVFTLKSWAITWMRSKIKTLELETIIITTIFNKLGKLSNTSDFIMLP